MMDFERRHFHLFSGRRGRPLSYYSIHYHHSERSKNIPVVKFRVISNLPRLFLHFTYINFSIVIMLGILAFSFNLQPSNISRYRCVSRPQSDFTKKNLFPLNHHHHTTFPRAHHPAHPCPIAFVVSIHHDDYSSSLKASPSVPLFTVNTGQRRYAVEQNLKVHNC